MSADDETETGEVLEFEAEFAQSPEMVWRAVTEPSLRGRWLPERSLADPEPVSQTPGSRVSYRMRDDEPPHLESLAIFEISPNSEGGTRLSIRHRLTDARATRTLRPANGNDTVMRAA